MNTKENKNNKIMIFNFCVTIYKIFWRRKNMFVVKRQMDQFNIKVGKISKIKLQKSRLFGVIIK